MEGFLKRRRKIMPIGTINSLLAGIEDSVGKFLGVPAHGYDFIKHDIDLNQYPTDDRGHRSDAVKNDLHPTSPKRAQWLPGAIEITDYGLYSPEGVNYTMWGARDNGDGDMVMTYKNTGVIPEVTVTPNGNYIKNTYDNIVYPVKTRKDAQ